MHIWQHDFRYFDALNLEILRLKQLYREFRPLQIEEIPSTLKGIDQEFIPILTSSGFANDLGQVRSLGRKGILSIVLDNDPKTLVFYSRYTIPVLSPSHLSQPEKYIQFLLDIGKTVREVGKVPLLVVVDAETDLPILIGHLSKLEESFVLTSDLELQEKLCDKYYQYEIAKEAGIPVTKTYLLDESFTAKKGAMKSPMLVKPRSDKNFYYKHGIQAILIRSRDELKANLVKELNGKAIIQEYICGPEEHNFFNFGAYCSKEHRPIGVFTGRRIRAVREFGSTACAESYDESLVKEYGLRYLDQIKYHGHCEIEFKKDPNDGLIKFVEINPRLWKWHSLAISCGVDLPYLSFLDATNGALPAKMPQQIYGTKWWLTLADIANGFSSGIKSHKELFEYLRHLSCDFVDGIHELDDPLPGLVNLLSFKWLR